MPARIMTPCTLIGALLVLSVPGCDSRDVAPAPYCLLGDRPPQAGMSDSCKLAAETLIESIYSEEKQDRARKLFILRLIRGYLELQKEPQEVVIDELAWLMPQVELPGEFDRLMEDPIQALSILRRYMACRKVFNENYYFMRGHLYARVYGCGDPVGPNYKYFNTMTPYTTIGPDARLLKGLPEDWGRWKGWEHDH